MQEICKKIWASAWDFQQSGMCDQQSLRSACANAQSDQSLCLPLEYSMSVKLLAEHHLELLSLKGGCTGSSESTLVKMPHCWKSRAAAQICYLFCFHFFCLVFGLTYLWDWMNSQSMQIRNLLSDLLIIIENLQRSQWFFLNALHARKAR